MIAQSPVADDAVRNNARIVREQSERMAQIIRQLLDFARAGKPNKTSVELRTLAASTLTLIRPIAEKRSVTLTFETGEPVPDVVADAAQLQQVVTNLVVNAIHASPPSSTVHNASLGPEFVCVTVTDHGVGMEEETLERIFEPFFTTKDVGEGTGLGLAVAYGIVQEHGGFITVESARGEGSRFEVYLPIQEPP